MSSGAGEVHMLHIAFLLHKGGTEDSWNTAADGCQVDPRLVTMFGFSFSGGK